MWIIRDGPLKECINLCGLYLLLEKLSFLELSWASTMSIYQSDHVPYDVAFVHR